MICIEDLVDSDKGRAVVYTDYDRNDEFGHITSWNNHFIFVDYGTSCGRGISTPAHALKFVKVEPELDVIETRFDILDL